ncbi:hypothetical protein GALL_406840 [mine drainage metagenome]|uniref:Uncharacterized protein n=1 Tax=mine drainage metagenome TaxID=410659 RepID=A0A1J5Q2S7_9ZZZZ
MQNAIDPVADDEAILEWLDVNIGRTRLHGTADDQTHQADDRSFACQILEVLDIFVSRFVRQGFDIANDLVHRRLARPVELLERRVEFGLDGKLRIHHAARGELERFLDVEVQWIDHRDDEPLPVISQRNRSGLLQEAQRDLFREYRQLWVVFGVSDRQIVLLCQRLGQILV